jgi:hypothetical protein
MTPKKLSMDGFNGIETVKLIQVFDSEKICEHCGIVGSFVIENDPIVGLCYDQIQKQYENIVEIVEN